MKIKSRLDGKGHRHRQCSIPGCEYKSGSGTGLCPYHRAIRVYGEEHADKYYPGFKNPTPDSR